MNSGILDVDEGTRDTDGDGIPDYLVCYTLILKLTLSLFLSLKTALTFTEMFITYPDILQTDETLNPESCEL